jgi:hypothetical protein
MKSYRFVDNPELFIHSDPSISGTYAEEVVNKMNQRMGSIRFI